MSNQPRTEKGQFGQKTTEKRGDAIALRLPASLDAQVRTAAGWQSSADNTALRDWVEGACKDRVSGATSPAPTVVPSSPGCTPEQLRAAINRVALTVQPRERGKALKLLNALMGELLANGD